MAEVKPAKPVKKAFKVGGSVSPKDLVVFTRQFSTMIDAGLPLVQALDILSVQTESPAFRAIIANMKEDVESGTTFADAVKKHPKVFDELYANMVQAGELGGILDSVLQNLADYIEKALRLKKKVKGAMTYPVVIISIAVVCIGVIMVFVVPTFAKMFASLGGTLPAPTRIIIAMSNFIAGWGGVIIVVVIVALTFIYKQIRSTDKGKYATDQIFLKLPVFGVLIQKVAVAKFTRTLGTLIRSGVPILEALENTAKTSGNKVVERTINIVRSSVTEGQTIVEPLSKSKVFPPMVTSMVSIGESTGALDSMLSKIADFYDEEVDQAVSNLTALMEPMMIVFLGGTVGFTVVAMYLPIFKMVTLIK
ncbi:type II secretion system F family protein [Candidatus Magnetominusculus xianensis]|uniref:Type II secretion system protein F n=1 Tax=Candidatus Magnetominusculus xianensis TaxID=1748249 RepID=A0ABR5SIP2_9BACT|nr:type II secretion system F family protein [Candidatus Magnetominusculus xianensis]KWT92828.1 type II secretion system protein F [Candidatus Magnetominusculus xianensis]MBF0403417.1 type II secretion system F family protein [Nitrospirota bacterium]